LADLHPKIVAVCRDLPGPPLFAAWYSQPVLKRLAVTVGAGLLTISAPMRAALEDKTRLDDLLTAARVSPRLRIPAVNAAVAPSFDEVTRRLGNRLVVQPAFTSGGRDTVFVDGRADYKTAVGGDGPWRIAQFITGFSSNATALTVPTAGGCDVYVDLPSHKPVGVAEQGITPAKGAGNDWSQSWPAAMLRELVDGIVCLGEYLYASHGLVGLWGVDTIWSDDRAFINEINIRNQGTTELSGVNQVLRDLPPLLVAHLTLLARGPVTWLPSAKEFNGETVDRGAAGGRAPYYIKLRNVHPHSVTPRPGWRGSGVYRLDTARSLVWLREGAHPTDADLDRCEILLANAPAVGVVCAPGAELGTVEGITSKPIFDGPASLSPLGRVLHRAATACFVSTGPKGSSHDRR
jgi:hypothetical protein